MKYLNFIFDLKIKVHKNINMDKIVIINSNIGLFEKEYSNLYDILKDFHLSTRSISKIEDSLNHKTHMVNGFIMRRIKEARNRCQRRKQIKQRKDNSGEFNITLDIILNKLKEQKGKCYYSNIPLVFKRKSDWMMSLERLDNSEGYTENNTVLVCAEFNSSDQSGKANNKTENCIKWSNKKFKYFIEQRS